jgi:hypothetical protein
MGKSMLWEKSHALGKSMIIQFTKVITDLQILVSQ